MVARPLLALDCPPGPVLLDTLVPALRRALDGAGPALLPLPSGDHVLRRRLLDALRPDEPVDDEVALVVPTSGSTGTPKGALLSAGALHASVLAALQRLGGHGRWLLALPVTHIAGLQVLLRSMQAGTDPEVLDLTSGFTADAFTAATVRLGPGRRYTSLVPTQLVRLLDAGGAAVEALTSYDAVLVGGAATAPAVLRHAREAGVAVVTTYGMSETCGGCVYDGTPLDGVRVEVAGDGRVRIAGPVLASGYRGGTPADAAAFAGGWFATRDAGRIGSDGRLEVLGRLDDVIVTGGEKVVASAVEAVLAEHPAVAEVAVVAVRDAEWGQRVEAVVVPRDSASPPTLAQVRRVVAERLGAVAAPRSLRVVEGLPLLPSGKVDRRRLSDPRCARPHL